MNTETIYKNLIEYVNTLEEKDGIMKMLNSGEKVKFGGVCILSNLLIDPREMIRADEAKKAGKGKIRTLAMNIVKNAAAKHTNGLDGAFNTSSGQYFCDGSRILRVDIPLDIDVPKYPREINFEKILAPERMNSIKINTPDAGELRTIIAEWKAYGKPGGMPKWKSETGAAYNAEWMLGMIRAIPDIELYESENNEAKLRPIYVKGAGVEGMILPIRQGSSAS